MGMRVDAVDVCELAIERAKQQPNSDLVNWIQADLLSETLFTDSAIQEASYDFVFDMQCFHCLRDIDEGKAARVIAAALRPGGCAMVVVGAVDPSSSDGEHVSASSVGKPGPPQLTLEMLRRPLEVAGLTTVQLSLSRLSPTPHYAVLPHVLPPLAWVGVFQKVPWSPARTYALEVQAPYSTYILQGRKTIETRAYPLPPCLLNQRVLLLEPVAAQAGVSSLPSSIPAGSALCRIVGSVTFTACALYTNRAQWEADREKHMVPQDSVFDWKDQLIITESNQTREFHSLQDGKINELYGWEVGSIEVFSDEEALAPALIRVYRSLFEVV
jgi:SAM-dependent methyltransferase